MTLSLGFSCLNTGDNRLFSFPRYLTLVMGATFPAVKSHSVKMTTHLHLVLKIKKCETILPLPLLSSWYIA